MSTVYYFRSKKEKQIKDKLKIFLKYFNDDFDNFINNNQECFKIDFIEDKLREITKLDYWYPDEDLDICTANVNGVVFKYTAKYSSICEIQDIYNSDEYEIINEYNEVFTWNEFLKEIAYDPNINYKWV